MKIETQQKDSSLLAVSKSLGAALILSLVLRPALIFPQQDISAYQKRLFQLSQQIKVLKTKIKKEEQKKASILSQLDSIGFKKNLIRKEIAVYNLQLEKANQELLDIKKKIPTLKNKLAHEKKSIEKILINLYKFGEINTLQLMLQTDDLSNFLADSKNLSLLAQYQNNIISEYIATLTELKDSQSKLEAKKEEILRLMQKANQKKHELEDEEKKNRALIQKIERNKKMHLQALDELKERSKELQSLIKKITKQELILPFTLIPLYEKKGKLPWPIEGRVITHFGLQRNPRFQTIIINNGIEISPDKGKMIIKTIHSGKVVYKDYFQGYGNLIIIDHGMNYYSLYGHCSDFLIEKGDFVKSGQPIAVIGDMSSWKGKTLYFELRYKTKPLNPLQWLKRR